MPAVSTRSIVPNMLHHLLKHLRHSVSEPLNQANCSCFMTDRLNPCFTDKADMHTTKHRPARWKLYRYLISQHPEVEERILQELGHHHLTLAPDGTLRDIQFEDLGRLTYLNCVIKVICLEYALVGCLYVERLSFVVMNVCRVLQDTPECWLVHSLLLCYQNACQQRICMW